MSSRDQQRIRRLLMAKALGFTESLRQLSREERQRSPSATIGEDYNKLRTQALQAFPHLADVIPPAATVVRGQSASYTSDMFYELFIFAEQIYQVLDVEVEEIGAELGTGA